ncbi:MBL fold metallo-hydrolase [Actinomadura sp. DSM 109109]|nr:MBL fold metallo-hydrolase [Actinomadura lepetitiana]
MSAIRSVEWGDVRLSYVVDGSVRLKPRGWLPETTDEDWRRHAAVLDESGLFVASIGGLLVERGDRAMLVDAGFGPNRVPDDPDNPLIGALEGGAFLESLEKLGRRPEEIEVVAYTHLHPDHIGWAGSFGEHAVSEPEWRHREETPAAERIRTVRDGEEIFPGVRVLPTPGHTPGHTAYVVESAGRRLIAFGDAFHSPVQITRPDWRVAIDSDPEQGIAIRRRLVEELRDGDTLGFGVHFADVAFGRVGERDGEPMWEPVDAG